MWGTHREARQQGQLQLSAPAARAQHGPLKPSFRPIRVSDLKDGDDHTVSSPMLLNTVEEDEQGARSYLTWPVADGSSPTGSSYPRYGGSPTTSLPAPSLLSDVAMEDTGVSLQQEQLVLTFRRCWSEELPTGPQLCSFLSTSSQRHQASRHTSSSNTYHRLCSTALARAVGDTPTENLRLAACFPWVLKLRVAFRPASTPALLR